MIKTNELRIGNLLDYEKTTHVVCGIKNNTVCSWWVKDGKAVIGQMQKDISGVMEDNPYVDVIYNYSPIKLTPAILVKLGFRIPIGGISFDIGKLSIYFGDTILSNENGRTYFNSWAILEEAPKYVHQLQNLYFALTGEELEYTF